MKSLIGKTLMISFLTLGLMIPIFMIRSLGDERKLRKNEVVNSLSSVWGPMHTVFDPVLETMEGKDGEARSVYTFPTEVLFNGEVLTEIRRKGIFKVPFYTAEFTLSVKFNTKKAKQPTRLVMLFSNRNFVTLENLKWNEKPIESERLSSYDKTGYWVETKEGLNTFTAVLKLRGIQQINFIPLAQKSLVQFKSNWTDPNFSGTYLPVTRTITKDGFTANWEVNGTMDVSNDYSFTSYMNQMYGVSFFVPVDIYQQTERSLKYSILFIFLTFIVFFLFEVLNPLRIHPLQYALVGFALCLFYLLLLSLSEHINFFLSFLAASLAIIIMITLYSLKVLKNKLRAISMSAFLTILYIFLYVLLQLEEYSLLLGSIALFILLGVVMYVTREIDWYSFHNSEEQ
jgi:inner membrane protein